MVSNEKQNIRKSEEKNILTINDNSIKPVINNSNNNISSNTTGFAILSSSSK